jgi:hypothetical protein
MKSAASDTQRRKIINVPSEGLATRGLLTLLTSVPDLDLQDPEVLRLPDSDRLFFKISTALQSNFKLACYL